MSTEDEVAVAKLASEVRCRWLQNRLTDSMPEPMRTRASWLAASVALSHYEQADAEHPLLYSARDVEMLIADRYAERFAELRSAFLAYDHRGGTDVEVRERYLGVIRAARRLLTPPETP